MQVNSDADASYRCSVPTRSAVPCEKTRTSITCLWKLPYFVLIGPIPSQRIGPPAWGLQVQMAGLAPV